MSRRDDERVADILDAASEIAEIVGVPFARCRAGVPVSGTRVTVLARRGGAEPEISTGGTAGRRAEPELAARARIQVS